MATSFRCPTRTILFRVLVLLILVCLMFQQYQQRKLTSLSFLKRSILPKEKTQVVHEPTKRNTTSQVCGVPDAFWSFAECPKQENIKYDTTTTTTTKSTLSPTIDIPTLAAALDCERLKNEMNSTAAKKQVNFLAVAHGTHADFLVSYAFFAMTSNPNSTVEIIVENPLAFVQRHAPALLWLLQHHHDDDDDDNVVANRLDFGNHSSSSPHPGMMPLIYVRGFLSNPQRRKKAQYHSWRYMEVPVLRDQSEYTYIGDVDIFLVEPVVETLRLEQMKVLDLPYSNTVRPGTERLTGLMLMKTKQFYTPALVEAQATIPPIGNDEKFLYKIVKTAGLGLPHSAPSSSLLQIRDMQNNKTADPLTYRPVHGLHLSLNRGPHKGLCLEDLTELSSPWCSVLVGTPRRLHDFWCHDEIGKALINELRERVEEQVRGNYFMKNGTCMPAA